jgi:hypothetical protein
MDQPPTRNILHGRDEKWIELKKCVAVNGDYVEKWV